MWHLIYNTFLATVASSAASMLCARLLRRKKFPLVAILLGALCGTVILSVSVALPDRIAPLRRALRAESAIEGIWIQAHDDPAKIKYATVRIRFNPSSSAFELDGWTYGLSDQDKEPLVSPRSEWRSLSMTVSPHAGNFEAVYSYSAKIKEGPLRIVDGFGTFTFVCKKDGTCNRATGYYLDTQIKNPVTFKMWRVRNEFDSLFSNNPEELVKIYHMWRYHKSPRAVTWNDDGA